MHSTDFIPFHKPAVGEEEISEVVATLRSGWLTTGERTHRFERDFGQYVDSPHALGVNSCTAALHIALAALGIGPGDEVITTPLTFCATVNTILHVGATPVLADIGGDGNICPEQIARRITPRTKAIVPVHLAGLPCDMDAIWALARRHGLYVIEDAAHACGSIYKNRAIGQTRTEPRSDAVAFSFYATKNITTGEGGMVTTADDELAAKMRRLALHGISRDAWDRYRERGNWFYDVVEPGFKYNLSDIQSAIGIHQLRKLESFIAERQYIAGRYSQAFSKFGEVEAPQEVPDSRHAWHLYILRLNLDALSVNRAAFIECLRSRNIGTSVHFIPIQTLPVFSGLAEANPCPEALKLYGRIISLPIYPGLGEAHIERVIAAVGSVIAEHRHKYFAVGTLTA